MLRYRVIPTLLLKNNGLVKTTKFNNPVYIGDPINAVKIFNDKEVDELVLLDITATNDKREPSYEKIREIVSEAFIPIGYGGGINTLNQIEKLFRLGIEKVILNTAIHSNPDLVKQASNIFGSQSIVAAIDVKKDFFNNYRIYSCSGAKKEKTDLVYFIKKIEELGAGEIIINSIDNDGTMSGYDNNLIKAVSSNVKVPVIASGGAGSLKDFANAIKDGGASAVAAGAMFVFQGKHRAVLISYPKYEELQKVLK
jgi:cyclase